LYGQGGEQHPVFKLGATDVGVPDDEPGVDWATWYQKWIKLVNDKVFQRMERSPNFTNDRNSYETVIYYTVSANGSVKIDKWTSEGTYNSGKNWATSARNLLMGLNNAVVNGKLVQPTLYPDGHLSPPTQIPVFPEGTTKTSLSRSFTFSHNMQGKNGVTLGGPPQETGR